MKLLVFAHIPPPHHGQSYMVKLMLDGLGGDWRRKAESGVESRESRAAAALEPSTIDHSIQCYHVDCRVSETLEDIGLFRLEKVGLLLYYCLEAIWCRFRYGIDVFYYVPAPGKRAALYRDWLVMALCRPFFRHFIHHWHAVGLGDWLATEGSWFERRLTHRLLGEPSLSIALAIPSMRDALWFRTKRVALVGNGVPDPCPDFDRDVLPQRRARHAARLLLLAKLAVATGDTDHGRNDLIFRVLYLAHCAREKGLFDVLEAIALANRTLVTQRSPLLMKLHVAGQFVRTEERNEFDRRIAEPDLGGVVTYHGFVSGAEKAALFIGSDCFCFPSYHESFGIVLLEAMAHGLPIIATRVGAMPEILPSGYPGLVGVHAPTEICAQLLRAPLEDSAFDLRQHFLAHYTAREHVENLRKALTVISEEEPPVARKSPLHPGENTPAAPGSPA